MTYTAEQLRRMGTLEEVIEWKRWRCGMGITQLEAAAMAGLHYDTVIDLERGFVKPQKRTLAKLQALMQRWPPEMAAKVMAAKRAERGPERRGAHLNKGSADGPL